MTNPAPQATDAQPLGEDTPPAEHHRTTLRGMAVLLWTVLFGVGLTAAVDALGLKYVQGIIWPTDLHTYGLQAPSGDLDVAILGSSRASFGLTPAVMDECLEGRLDRPTRTVNLARVFATGHTMRPIYRDFLHRDPPKLLLLAIAPEALDDTNPKMASSISGTASIPDIPRELSEARGLREGLSALRPVVRGAETLPFYLAGRHTNEARLQWMMNHHGGGQWCTGSEACDNQNDDLSVVMERRWDEAVRTVLGAVRMQHFGEYVAGEGRVHEAMLEVIDDARADGAQVAIVVMPLHEAFAAEIPERVRKSFAATLDLLAEEYSVPVYRPDVRRWAGDKRSWVDPDHLARRASFDLSRAVCHDVVHPLLTGEPIREHRRKRPSSQRLRRKDPR